MKDVYIVEAKRTAIGSFLGSLCKTHPSELGSVLIKDIMNRIKIEGTDIDEVLVGNILPAGLGQGLGRQIVIKSGLPLSVCGSTLNMVCGSGMKTVMNAYANIGSGIHKMVFAGGVENMSMTPFLSPSTVRNGHKFGDMSFKDHMVFDSLTCAIDQVHMGITAENIQEKLGITREEQDLYAFNSQQKALNAIKEGKFVEEIVPIQIKQKRELIDFSIDEYPNSKSTIEKLSTLRPAFKKDGTVTAGNASGINDGGSMILLCNQEMVDKYQFKPLAKIVGVAQAGIDYKIMGLGPVDAVKKVLDSTQLTIDEIDLIEFNEAFAVQSIGVIQELSKDLNVSEESIYNKTNVNGGAIALGHPVGTSGNRIIVTLIHELIRRNQKYGLASLCIGGGMGTAVVVENVR